MQIVENIVVKVTRRGQTTIPQSMRKRFGIKEGDRLIVEATENGILFKPVPNILGMIGIDSEYATVEEVNKMIDKIREEY
ncbi:AbrB/MazE/SpoVT family DNA-binding domain-containing protein [Candidatus Bathyarchaeota archaeon]|nr:AbrB/MazE/SpoVT family DNA-binding domain-containing protein [Candidatus Bathyarchaeota archaeon]